jgi:hypothetical protein
MHELRTQRAKLLAPVGVWRALGVGLGVAFGDSLGRAVLWIVVAVAVGLVIRGRGEIAAWFGRRRPRDHP